MSCGAHDESRDIKFSSKGPEDKSPLVAGSIPDGNPLAVALNSEATFLLLKAGQRVQLSDDFEGLSNMITSVWFKQASCVGCGAYQL